MCGNRGNCEHSIVPIKEEKEKEKISRKLSQIDKIKMAENLFLEKYGIFSESDHALETKSRESIL